MENIYAVKKIGKAYVWSPDQVDLIKDLYTVQAFGRRDIAKMFGVSLPVIENVMKANGIETCNLSRHKWKLDEHYFDHIDTPNKAYMLGFIAADGCLSNCYTLEMSLHHQDKCLLEAFNKELKSNRPLEFIDNSKKREQTGKNYGDQYRFRVQSKILYNALNALGIHSNKSLSLQFPNIPEEYLNHFVRGYLHGDGCIYTGTMTDGRPRILCNFTSTQMFCKDLQKRLYELLGVSGSIKNLNCNNVTATLSYGGDRQAKTVLDWIYHEADLYLDRKYQKYQSYYTSNIS